MWHVSIRVGSRIYSYCLVGVLSNGNCYTSTLLQDPRLFPVTWFCPSKGLGCLRLCESVRIFPATRVSSSKGLGCVRSTLPAMPFTLCSRYRHHNVTMVRNMMTTTKQSSNITCTRILSSQLLVFVLIKSASVLLPRSVASIAGCRSSLTAGGELETWNSDWKSTKWCSCLYVTSRMHDIQNVRYGLHVLLVPGQCVRQAVDVR